jgi:hypothetical protein
LERFSQDTCSRRLPDASRAGKQEGMSDPVEFNGVLERPGDVLLSDDFFKYGRSPLSGKDKVGHDFQSLFDGH